MITRDNGTHIRASLYSLYTAISGGGLTQDSDHGGPLYTAHTLLLSFYLESPPPYLKIMALGVLECKV